VVTERQLRMPNIKMCLTGSRAVGPFEVGEVMYWFLAELFNVDVTPLGAPA